VSSIQDMLRQGGGMMKKEWSKPKLIGLYHNKPEEAVLGLRKAKETQSKLMMSALQIARRITRRSARL